MHQGDDSAVQLKCINGSKVWCVVNAAYFTEALLVSATSAKGDGYNTEDVTTHSIL